jgi:hypothetical protein
MTTQLRLVDTKATPATRPARRARVAKATKTSKARRAAHWHTEWRLDDRTRQVGQEGVAAARQALAQARGAEERLPRAS